MAEVGATPWMPSTKTFIASAIRKLVDEGEQRRACVLLVRQACAGQFGVLANTLAEMSDFSLKGMKILLSEQAVGSYALQYAVSQTGITDDLYPLVARSIDLARDARKASGKALGPQAQAFLLKKILELPEIKALKLPRQFIDALFENIERPDEEALLAMIGREAPEGGEKKPSESTESENQDNGDSHADASANEGDAEKEQP